MLSFGSLWRGHHAKGIYSHTIFTQGTTDSRRLDRRQSGVSND